MPGGGRRSDASTAQYVLLNIVEVERKHQVKVIEEIHAGLHLD